MASNRSRFSYEEKLCILENVENLFRNKSKLISYCKHVCLQSQKTPD